MKIYQEKGMPHPSTAGFCPKCKTVDFVITGPMELITCPNCNPELCSPNDLKIKAVYNEEYGHWCWTKV